MAATTISLVGSGAWGDMLTSYNGHAITYDELGNPLTYYNGQNYAFTWRGRQMTSLTKDGVTYYFEYDDEGHRVKKTKGGEVTCYYYSGDRLIAEICNEEYLIVYLYDENGSPIGFQYHDTGLGEEGWVTLWYEKNLQGDVVALYTDAGVKLVTYTYDAYGNCSATYIKTNNWLIDTLATQNPIRYRGYYYDFELELYCLGTRYYDSATGRFLSPDSVDYLGANGDLNSYNLYAYCSNNPIMHVDPMGKWTFSINLTFFIGFGGGYSFSIGLSADSNKDLAIQYSYSAPNSDNTRNTVIGATISGGVAFQYTELDSVDDLNDYSKVVGANIPVGSFDIIKNAETNKNVGWSVGVGPSLGGDIHINETKTKTIGDKFSSPSKIIKRLVN